MAVISGRRKRMNTKYSSGLTRPRIQMIAMMTRGITQGCGRRNVEIRKQTTKTSLRSEEHTSELQSPCNLVCRLLLEKKNNPEVYGFDAPASASGVRKDSSP